VARSRRPLRLEEACQLHVADVSAEDGVPCIMVKPGDGKQLKSKAAVRRVPVHPILVRAGFLSFVDEARKTGRTMLFDSLRRGCPDKRLGYYWTKWFGEYRRAVGIAAQGVDFHAFRHSFTTALEEADVSRAIIDQLTGHEGTGETSRYTKALSVAKLHAAVQKVKYGKLTLTHLHAAPRQRG
jgi:integrase